jgi:hypothetical protein
LLSEVLILFLTSSLTLGIISLSGQCVCLMRMQSEVRSSGFADPKDAVIQSVWLVILGSGRATFAGASVGRFSLPLSRDSMRSVEILTLVRSEGFLMLMYERAVRAARRMQEWGTQHAADFQKTCRE